MVKGFFSGALGVVIIVGFIILSGLTLVFGIRVVAFIYPILLHISSITLAISIFILLPLAIFKKSRIISGWGLIISSYIFGVSLWMYSFLVTYTYWGVFGLVIALFMLGIGVTPIAIVASLFHWDWATIGNIAFGLVITFGARFLAIYLGEKVDKAKLQEKTDQHTQTGDIIEATEIRLDNGKKVYRTSHKLLPQALQVTQGYETITASVLQTSLEIGYSHAAMLLDEMEELNLIAESKGASPRKVYRDNIDKFLLTTEIKYIPTENIPVSINKPETELFSDAVKIVANYQKASASLLQRKLGLGYSRSVKLLEKLEEFGIVSEANNEGLRNVLIKDSEIESALTTLSNRSDEEINEENKIGKLITTTLEAFGIQTRIQEINKKKSGIEYCLEVAVGSSIENLPRLEKDIAMAVASPTGKVKIQAPIPGRSLIGITIPLTK